MTMGDDEQYILPKDTGLKRFLCTTCGYMYDPSPDAWVGIDPGVPPHTPFGSLPDDWACPLCGTGRGEFESMDGKKLCNRFD